MDDKDLRSQLEGLFSDLEAPGLTESHGAPSEGQLATQEGAKPDVGGPQLLELELTDAALQESESRLRAILDNVQTGILIIEPDVHIIVDVNPAAAKLIGAPKEQIVGAVCHKYVCPADKGKCPITDLSQRVDNSERILLTADGGSRSIIKTVTTVMLGGRVHLLESFVDITERKQAEEALARERSLLRTLIDNLPDLIYVKDTQSQFVIVNLAQARLLGGTTPDDLSGKSDFDFFPPELAQKYYADEQAILQSGQPLINVEEPTTDTAGHKKWLATTKVPLRDSNGQVVGFVGVGRDITERKQTEESLRKSEEKYRTILENMQEGYFEVDLAGNFTFFNDALCRVLGYSRDELMGMNNREYMDAENAEAVYRIFNEIYRTKRPSPTSSYEVIRKDGAKRSIEMSTSLMTGSMGEPIGFQGILRDITERKRAEETLERRAMQLQTAAEVSRAASSISDPDELLSQVVGLIRDRFNLYYAGLFLVDETGQRAVLRAGTGEAGQKMLEAHHQLEIGGSSMIAWCIANRQARIALDVGQEAVRFANSLLPKTRSEMALPLISRDIVIGAMTIQSDQPAAFAQEDISVLQSMADQTANAIENARLFEESRRRAAREQMLNTMAARIRAGLTLDQVLNMTVQQVGAALGATRVAVQLKPVRGDSSQTMAREKEG
jgi:PAS domain S-box-containing protein